MDRFELRGNNAQERNEIEQWVQIGHLCFEKCELDEAEIAFSKAYSLAQEKGSPEDILSSLVGLLRFAGESQDKKGLDFWFQELERFKNKFGDRYAPYWFALGHLTHFQNDLRKCLTYFTKAYKKYQSSKASPQRSQGLANTMVLIIRVQFMLGHQRRAEYMAHVALKQFEGKKIKKALGPLYYQLGYMDEEKGKFAEALQWYKKAHAQFLSEHNWFYHLYALLGYARIARHEGRLEEARWNLELIRGACVTKEFNFLLASVEEESKKLETIEIDLTLDANQGVVITRERGPIPIGKQYILLEILKELIKTHETQIQKKNGLTKAEIIQRVWNEPYRPEAHDNKLYYNINRLRKLIEADSRKPKYLMNWKEGYRIHPDLKVCIQNRGGKL